MYFVMMPLSIFLFMAGSASAFAFNELDTLGEHTVVFCRGVESHGYGRYPSKVLLCSRLIVPHGYPFLFYICRSCSRLSPGSLQCFFSSFFPLLLSVSFCKFYSNTGCSMLEYFLSSPSITSSRSLRAGLSD